MTVDATKIGDKWDEIGKYLTFVTVNDETAEAENSQTVASLGLTNYWQRVGTTVSPLTAGDDVSIGSGNLQLQDNKRIYLTTGLTKYITYNPEILNPRFDFNASVKTTDSFQVLDGNRYYFDTARTIHASYSPIGGVTFTGSFVRINGADLRLENTYKLTFNHLGAGGSMEMYGSGGVGTTHITVDGSNYTRFLQHIEIPANNSLFLNGTLQTKSLTYSTANTRFEFNDRVKGSTPTATDDLTTKAYVDDKRWLMQYSNGSNLTGNQTGYFCSFGAYVTNTPAEIRYPACSIKRITVLATTNTLNSASVFTVMVNNVASALTVTIGAGVITRQTATNSITIADGDLITVRGVIGGTGGQSIALKEITLEQTIGG